MGSGRGGKAAGRVLKRSGETAVAFVSRLLSRGLGDDAAMNARYWAGLRTSISILSWGGGLAQRFGGRATTRPTTSACSSNEDGIDHCCASSRGNTLTSSFDPSAADTIRSTPRLTPGNPNRSGYGQFGAPAGYQIVTVCRRPLPATHPQSFLPSRSFGDFSGKRPDRKRCSTNCSSRPTSSIRT